MTAGSAPRRRVLVMLSGGLDSTVALHWALDRGHDVEALIVHWPGQPDGERRAARRVTERLGVELTVVTADWLKPPPGGRPEGYIPHRNVALYGLAAHVAGRRAFDAIVAGHTGEDGEDFPDATASFFDDLGAVMTAGAPRGAGIEILLPLMHLDKPGVVALGRGLGVDIDATWSCYRSHDEPCGTCPSCQERHEAVHAAAST